MTKQEKYINHIVDHLIKNTYLDFDNGYVGYPHTNGFMMIEDIEWDVKSRILWFLKDDYGARDSDIPVISKLYKERIKELVGIHNPEYLNYWSQGLEYLDRNQS